MSNIELDFIKTLFLLTTSTKAKVRSKRLVNNHIKETSNTQILAGKTTEQIKIKPTVSTKEGENNPFQSAGNMEENKIALFSKKNSKNTQFVATKLASLPLTEAAEFAENTNTTNNFITPLSTQINTSITVSTYDNIEVKIKSIPQRESFTRIIYIKT